MARFLVLGDIHGNTQLLRHALLAAEARAPWDAVLCTGDLGIEVDKTHGPWSHVQSVREVLVEIRSVFGATPIFFVPGNHDHPTLLGAIPGNIEGRIATVAGVTVAGVGGAVGKFGFPYEPTEEQMGSLVDTLPLMDVLLLHQPPSASLLARCERGHSGGSRALQARLEHAHAVRPLKCRAFACGHIHEAFGVEPLDRLDGGEPALGVNAGSFGRPHAGCRFAVLEVPAIQGPCRAEIVEVEP